MKKIVTPLIIVALLFTTAFLPACNRYTYVGIENLVSQDYDWTRFQDDNITLNIFNWGEYIAQGSGGEDGIMDVIREFTALTGIRVNYTTYDTNESLFANLIPGDIAYDVVFPSDYMVGRLVHNNMLRPLNFDNIPNIRNIDPDFRNMEFAPYDAFAVPYTWGTVVLIYNSAYVDTPTSWDVLWNEDNSGQIVMIDNSRDAFAIAQLLLGYSVNTENEDELISAAIKLFDQRGLVQRYAMDEVFNIMVGGEAWFAIYYAGDAITMMEANPDLNAVVPNEGSNMFVDFMVIPAVSRNPEAAEMFINFMLEAHVAAATAEFIGYATPNAAAYPLIDAELRNNPLFNPPYEVIAKTFPNIFLNQPEHINEKIATLWNDLRAGNRPGN